jgi:hypothetical protein
MNKPGDGIYCSYLNFIIKPQQQKTFEFPIMTYLYVKGNIIELTFNFFEFNLGHQRNKPEYRKKINTITTNQCELFFDLSSTGKSIRWHIPDPSFILTRKEFKKGAVIEKHKFTYDPQNAKILSNYNFTKPKI